MTRRGQTLLLIGVFALIAGCTSKSAVFPGRSPEQVWTAVVAVAEQPHYDRWVVAENNVWVDPTNDRLEVQRTLKRDLHRQDSPAVREVEKLEMQIVLERTEPPAVTATMRNSMLRGKAIIAIDHFFNEVRELLGGGVAKDMATDATCTSAAD